MSEQDTSEKLEADVKEWCATYPTWNHANEFREHVFEWLDRQAAITEREVKERVNFSLIAQTADALFPDYQERIDELASERDELQKRNEQLEYANKLASKSEARKIEYIDQLEAERDQLSRDLEAEHALLCQFEDDNERMREAVDAMGCGQLYAMYEELRAEVDNLRKRNASQADTIRKLRAEFDAALDDLARAVEDKRSHPF